MSGAPFETARVRLPISLTRFSIELFGAVLAGYLLFFSIACLILAKSIPESCCPTLSELMHFGKLTVGVGGRFTDAVPLSTYRGPTSI